jgi:Zn-dependent protease
VFSRRPLFHAFGIPVTVDPFFFFGLFIFYSVSGGGRAGVYTAVALAVFVLIHELGHATVARRMGADVEITLNFMVGWASYSHSRELSRWQRNLISVMGPVTELVVAVVALWALRQWLLVPGMTDAEWALYVDLYEAITFAGIMLAVLNLLPMWPLDGGHIAESWISTWFGPRGRRAFLVWTIVVSAALAVFSLVRTAPATQLAEWAARLRTEGLVDPFFTSILKNVLSVAALAVSSDGFVFVWLFCALGAYQALRALNLVEGRISGVPAPSRRALARDEVVAEVRTAERRGWMYHERHEFPKGWGPSPWLSADLARREGATEAELPALLSALGDPRRAWQVDRLDRPEIGALLPYVPPAVAHTPAVVEARVFHGPPDALVDAALATYHGDPGAEGFYLVAEGLAQRGLLDDAMSWLTAAVERHPDPRRVATSRPLSVLHGRSDFQQLLGVAERRVPNSK